MMIELALDHISSKTSEESNQSTQSDEKDQIISTYGVNDNYPGR